MLWRGSRSRPPATVAPEYPSKGQPLESTRAGTASSVVDRFRGPVELVTNKRQACVPTRRAGDVVPIEAVSPARRDEGGGFRRVVSGAHGAEPTSGLGAAARSLQVRHGRSGAQRLCPGPESLRRSLERQEAQLASTCSFRSLSIALLDAHSSLALLPPACRPRLVGVLACAGLALVAVGGGLGVDDGAAPPGKCRRRTGIGAEVLPS